MGKRAAQRAPLRNVLMPQQRPAPSAAALLIEAQRLLAGGRADGVVTLLSDACADPLHRAEALYLSAIAALMAKRVDEALVHAQGAAAARPDVARYQFALGRAFKAAANPAAAAAAYRRAIELQPAYAEAMVSLGIVRKDQGEFDEAISLYERALGVNPRLAAAHANRANALSLRAERRARQGFDAEPDPAVLDAQGRAVALDAKNPQLHKNYGVLLLQARRHAEAVAAFNEALTLDQSDVECCLRLGDALQDLGAVALECEAYRTWLARNPPDATVMRALSSALTRMGEGDQALRWAEQALALDPDPITALQHANVLQQLRRMAQAMAASRRALDSGGRLLGMYPNVLLGSNYFYEDPEPIFALHAEFGALLPPAATTARPAWRAKPPGQRLRIGYVSGDFLRHSVAYFVQPLLAAHDRERFEVVCYQNNAHSDEMTAQLKAFGHEWVECAGWSDNALRSRIAADRIDILIDLSGHTAHSRLPMLAAPCAPVQIVYLGYPTVTGVPSIGYRITDAVIDPGDLPPFASEAPLRLPHTMFCYAPDPSAPALAAPPAHAKGFVTFGSFNNVAKVTDRTLELWAAAMRAVPQSRLLLKAATMSQASVRSDIEAFMAARGIAADRLTLIARTPNTGSHLALYNEVDIALDTFPYNGATTTCEALWMGVPVVTLRGRTHTSRMGASILSAIGHAQWVAPDDAGYVARAVALAGDLAALAHWRTEARARLRASPLLDQAAFARSFENLLHDAWRQAGPG
jgi:protein O-GlcNAc transferase